MQKPKSAFLLVGSPKGTSSNSNSLGTYLLQKLQDRGVATKSVYLTQALASDKKEAALLEQIDQSDLIILAFPLYVDSLHSQVIRTLEIIAQHRKSHPTASKRTLTAIVNSGFPEANHNQTALTVCRLFAREAGFDWAGGLAMGGGMMIEGKPLTEIGGRVRNQTKALEIAADALAKGEHIPDRAAVLMAKLPIPKVLFLWMGDYGWKQLAKKQIDVKQMYIQPYKEP